MLTTINVKTLRRELGRIVERWEWIDPVRAERARAWFFGWADKTFSFTDCTSFVVMDELGLKKALTTDRHFRQAGFESLPTATQTVRLARQ